MRAPTRPFPRRPPTTTTTDPPAGLAKRTPIAANAQNDYTLRDLTLTLHGKACAELQAAAGSDPTTRVEAKLGCASVPGPEVCDDGVDNDCDEFDDDGCASGSAPPIHGMPSDPVL